MDIVAQISVLVSIVRTFAKLNELQTAYNCVAGDSQVNKTHIFRLNWINTTLLKEPFLYRTLF